MLFDIPITMSNLKRCLVLLGKTKCHTPTHGLWNATTPTTIRKKVPHHSTLNSPQGYQKYLKSITSNNNYKIEEFKDTQGEATTTTIVAILGHKSLRSIQIKIHAYRVFNTLVDPKLYTTCSCPKTNIQGTWNRCRTKASESQAHRFTATLLLAKD